MTQAELYTALKSLGFPVAYSSFTTSPSPPFITYHFSYSNDVMADNINYAEISNFQIELYTKTKDLTAEGKMKAKLRELELPFSKVEAWLEEDKLHQIIYEIQLIGE